MNKPTLIALTSLLLGVFFDVLFYGKTPGLSVILIVLLTLSATLGLAYYFKKPLTRSTYLLMAPLLFFASMVMVRASGFLSFLNIVAVLALLVLALDVNLKPRRRLADYGWFGFIAPLVWLWPTIFRHLFNFCVVALTSRQPKQKAVLPVVRGLLIGLPIVFIFGLLFASADAVFKSIAGSLFDFKVSPDLVAHVIFIGTISGLYIGSLALLFIHGRRPEATEQANSNRRSIGVTETCIVLGLVNFLFGLFVLIQLAYLFGGQNHLMSTGLTYAEYARRGFFELLCVAVISLGLILVFDRVTERSTQHQLTFRWLSVALIAQVLIIMVSAFKRLNLYQQAYGYTLPRLYGYLFLIWLAVMFVVLLRHIWQGPVTKRFALEVVGSIIVFLALLNLLSPESIVARQNIKRYEHTGKLDVHYLLYLSEDAQPAITRLFGNQDLKNMRAIQLRQIIATRQVDRYKFEQQTNWPSFNLSRWQAKQNFQSHQVEFNANYNLWAESNWERN